MNRFTRAAATAVLALITAALLTPRAAAQPDIRGRFNGFGQSSVIVCTNLPPATRSFFDVFIEEGPRFSGRCGIPDNGVPDNGIPVNGTITGNGVLNMTGRDGEFHFEDYSFKELIEHWLDGELPELHTGEFYRAKE